MAGCFSMAEAEVWTPSGVSIEEAAAATTHLCVAAHQDDAEILAYHGIAACFRQAGRGFGCMILADGAGSPRSGDYGAVSDAEMAKLRRQEQRAAAMVGGYAFLVQAGYASEDVRGRAAAAVEDDIFRVLEMSSPHTVYMHNFADRHDTHVAAAFRTIAALRRLPPGRRPAHVYGVEVWGSLDWLPAAERVMLPCDARPNLAAALLGVFDTQITGGKRYDLATVGRRLANATFHSSHATDQVSQCAFAMDLSPLLADASICPVEFTLAAIGRFRADTAARMNRFRP